MPYAIILCIEDKAAPGITKLWEALAENSISRDQINFNYPPHVTLAVYDSAVNTNALMENLARIAGHWTSMPVKFEGLRIMPPSALLVAPVVKTKLRQRQAAVYAALPPAAAVPDYYKPGNFKGHITLARDIIPKKMPEALAVVTTEWEAFTAELVSLDIIRFYPETGYSKPTERIWRRVLTKRKTARRIAKNR